MASVISDAGGRKRIQFVGADGKRRTVRLGVCGIAQARGFASLVDELIAANWAHSVSPDTAKRIAALPDTIHDRLARVGLVVARSETRATVGQLIDRYKAAAIVKPATLAAYEQTFGSLRDHFGKDRALASIKAGDAELWRKALTEAKLSPATQAKRVFVARAMFKRAVRWGLVGANAFAELKAGSQANPRRAFYVSREVTEKVLAQCPDDEWRAIVALARYAGLRCPSEPAGLHWRDVDWDARRLTVRSPKTEGHGEAHAVRSVPIDPALYAILRRLFDAAPDGATLIVPRLADPRTNIRTSLTRYVENAGLTAWPRLVQNLRASAATDWCERFPAHTVAAWLGHSPMIAARHYLTTRDSHFTAAAGIAETGDAKSGAQAAHFPTPTGNASERHNATDDSEMLVGAGLTPKTTIPATSHGDRQWARRDSNPRRR